MIKRVKDEMSAVVSVPNGTAAAGTKLEHFIARGRSLLAQTALGIIGFAVTVIEAEAELSPAEFAQFCAGVGLDPGGSSLRKVKKIGQEASRFEPFIDKTPGHWTTLHVLAVLEKPEFDQVVHDDRYGPMITAKTINTILFGDDGDQTSEQVARDLTLDFTGFDRDKMRATIARLKQLKEEFGFRYEIGSDIIKQLMPAHKKSKPTLEDLL